MKTKSLSLLIALALLITIGGVYAAWMCAESDMTAVHGHIGSFGLANAVINNSKGTITVDASNAHLTLDQTSATDYTAKLVATGTITFTFSPSDVFKNSNPDLDEYAMNYSLTTDNASPMTFTVPDGTGDDRKLFHTFNTTTTTQIVLEKNAGNYVATINAADLLNGADPLIVINTFTLDTYQKYTDFSNKLGTFGNIGIQISEIAA